MISSSRLVRALAPLAFLFAGAAAAEPYIVADAETGDVLMQSDATEPWFPASTTKLMTVYVALNAVREGRLTMDTPLTMSVRASHAPPSKMGFRPGTLVTLDNALKMLMVKSPNDVALMIGESISGSVGAFASEMNAAAARLGMHESHFVNPNGLHNDEHYSSARDMAILARALVKEFPEHADLFSIGALSFGGRIIRNHNGLIGRYPGADGMKTGFTCPAGWNVVATAQQNGRKLIVVIFGSVSPRIRTNEAAMLFDRGFQMSSTGQKLETLPASAVTEPPNMRNQICRGRGRAGMLAMQEDFVASAAAEAPITFTGGRSGPQVMPMMTGAMAAPPHAVSVADERVAFEPLPVFVGPKPGWTGPVLAARGEDEADTPVSAFAAQKEEGGSAPSVLKNAVKPVAKIKRPLMTREARARAVAAAHRVAKKSQSH